MARITETEAREIAASYGVTNERTWFGDYEQANKYDGTPAHPQASWGHDNHPVASQRRVCARELFDGYMAQVAAERSADERSHDAFCRDAYGCDA